MSYLLDRKNQRKKYFSIFILVVFLFVIFYFRVPIFTGLSRFFTGIFRPVLSVKTNIDSNFSNTGAFIYSKKFLLLENQDLKNQLLESASKIANYKTLEDENIKLKEILNRKPETANLILASILGKSNQSIYNTLIIDMGSIAGVEKGQLVLALGNIPIGKVVEVFPKSSKVVLFSSPGESTEVVVGGGDVFMNIVGRGGGNFEMVMPRDFKIDAGAEVVLPGIYPYFVATVATIISDPRDSFSKALLVSPVNINELKFVEVKR